MFGPRWHTLRGLRLPLAASGIGITIVAAAALAPLVFTSPGSLVVLKPPKETPPVIELSEREFLWEVEHHGNLLGKQGFKAFAEAVARADRGALRAMLAANFAASDLAQPKQVRRNDPSFEVIRRQEASGQATPLNREEFVDWLQRYRGLFHRPPKVQMKYATLSPESRQDLDEAWNGRAYLILQGETAPGQPAEVEIRLDYRIARPTAENFARGGWLRSLRVTQTREGHAKSFLLREVARERGIDASGFYDTWTSPEGFISYGGTYLCDFNRDGYVDMLLTDANRKAILYQGGPGGKFTDVTRKIGLPEKWVPGFNGVAAIADLDGDGWEDFIISGRIFHNVQGRYFEDVTDRSNLKFPLRYNGVTFADYNRDGLIDVYFTVDSQPLEGSWIDGKCGKGAGNHLWRNRGNWQFEDVTAETGTDGGNRSVFAAAWLDADNDGWPDLFVPNEFGNGVLLLNQHDGKFKPRPLADGPTDFGSMGVVAGDFDNDGNIDLYLANMYSKAGTRIIGNLKPDAYPPEVMAKLRRLVAGSQLHRNRGGLRFDQLGSALQVDAVGWAYGPGVMDLDNDGYLDIFAPCGFFSRNRDNLDG
jgi:hypothetical protein